ncbi:Aldo/keto reductase, partial [Martensiomyces pterosporus]
VGLGCGTFSGAYGPASDEEVVGTVRKALSSGINLVDTSPYYNNSEMRLGKALAQLKDEFPRSSYHICTKLGRYGYKIADFDYSAKRVVASVNESMRRLNTDYLDIVLCHDVEFVDIAMAVDEALPQLFELKARGLVRNVGISGYPLEVLLRIAEIQQERSSPLDVVLSYCSYNLHCQRLAEYVPKLRAAGVKTVIAASPLSMGLLSSDTTPEWHPAKPELKAAV